MHISAMENTAITCSTCKAQVQSTRYGMQYRCVVCGHALTSDSPVDPKPQISCCRGDDHKGEHNSLRMRVRKLFHTNGTSNNCATSNNSTYNIYNVHPSSSSSRNSSSSGGGCSSISSSNSSSSTLKPSPAGTTSMRLLSSPAGGPQPKKRALLCGVTYRLHKYKLKGTRNDVDNMQDLLTNTFGYHPHCIRILSEDDPHALDKMPTKKNIENSLRWLVDGCQEGDSLVFYFSGHGLRQPDFKEDEIDGFDETICPSDFMTEGMILDNDINTAIVSPLKEGVTLHAIVDACHSGTILDLEHVYNQKEKKWVDNFPPSRVSKRTSGGLAISLSACEDDKMAADTTAFSSKKMNGAMTYILTETLRTQREVTYGALLDMMIAHINKVNNKRRINSRILRKIFRPKTIQEPLLSSSEIFDLYSKKFIL